MKTPIRRVILLALLCAGTLVLAIASMASTIAYTDGPGNGTQAFGGNLGLNFNVNTPLFITSLGVFNASGSGTITGNISVAIFNNTTHTLVTPIVSFHGSYVPGGVGFNVFKAITPVALAVGSYQVTAVGFGVTDMNGNLATGSSGPVLDSGGGALSFNGAAFDSIGTLLDNPQSCGGCAPLPQQSMQFDAGTFIFTTSTPIPESGTMGLLASGILAAAGALHRKLCR